MMIPSFVGGSYVAQSPIVDAELTVNFFVEQLPPVAKGAKVREALYPRPGTKDFATVTTPGVWRGSFGAQAGRAFGIVGNRFYEFFSNGTATDRGTVAVDENPATICSNGDGGDQLMITSGTNLYIYNLLTNTLTQVASMNGKATMGDMLDGYFAVLDAATSSLYISGLLDGLTWDPAQVAQRSLAGDPWKAMIVSRSQRVIVLVGELTGETWYNAGSFPYPFSARPDVVLPYGTAAPFSLRDVGGTAIWLTQNKEGKGQVVVMPGLNPTVISTFALRVAFHGYSSLDGFVAQTFEYLGHTFYLMTSAIAKATWVFDLTTSTWVEWLTWIPEDRAYTAWRPFYYLSAFGKHLMGDRESGTLHEISHDYATDPDGKAIRWLRRAPLPWADNKTLFCSLIEVLLEPGLGLSSGQGSDPQVMMRMSWDGGKRWSAERMRSAGKQGEYGKRVRFERCGSGRKPVVEVVMTDPIKGWRLIGLEADLKVGDEAAA